MVASPPISLIPAFKDLFPISGSVPISSARTNKLRMALIAKMAYIDSPEYNKRYKRQDVKDALVNIYKNKCAFCEKIIEQYHVEHYRPKKTYYWLAFSWDNLLLACATCNQFKGANFAILGKAIAFTNSEHNIRANQQHFSSI
jgi:hypothetical protein